MVITMATRTIIPYVCLLVLFTAAASAGTIEHVIRTADGLNFGDSNKPMISVIDLSSGDNTIPRQGNFEKQFYSPHSFPDLLRSSNVFGSPSETFGQKTKSTNPSKPAKHSFYIVTPTANLKRNAPHGGPNAKPQQSIHESPTSAVPSGEHKDNSENKRDEFFVIKRDSNRFDAAPAALSAAEDVLTDAGLLSSFGSSLFSNDALSSQNPRDSHSFGIPLPSSPPINSDTTLFTATPENLINSQDILSLTQNLSPQDVTAFTNSLSPEEVTSLTKNLLKSLNIESKDLDDILNLGGPVITSNLEGNSGQGQSSGIPFPNVNFIDAFESASRTRASGGASVPRTNSHAFGIPFPEIGSHSSSGNLGKELSPGASISSGNSESFFGIPLPGLNSDSTSNSFDQSHSIGIPLSESGSDFSTGNADELNSIYNTPTSSNNFQTFDQLSSIGVPLPGLKSNSFSASSGNQENLEQTLNGGSSQSVGIPLPKLKSDVSSFGIPLPELTSASLPDGFGQTQTFGVPLPRFSQGATSSSHDSLSEASGQRHSLGIPLPGLNSGFSDGLNNVKSVGIPLPGINPDDSGNNFFTPLTVVSEGNTKFSLNKDGNNNILSSSSSAKLSPVFVGTPDDDDKKTVSVDVNLSTKSDPFDSLTIGQLLMGMNGQNGIVVLPMSSLNDVKSKASGLTVVADSSAEGDDKVVVNLSNIAATTSAPAVTTTRRARRTTTTTKAPDTFRVTLSDLLYSKGQWFGTLFGGMIDYGRIAWNTVQDHINSQPTYNTPTYGTYNTYGG